MILMIICVCHRLSTRHVNEALDAGARSPRQVHSHHKTRINCGKCSETVCQMIGERRAASGQLAAGIAAE